jgi:hypothetical protein
MRSVPNWLNAVIGGLVVAAALVVPAAVRSADQGGPPNARGLFVEELRNTQPSFHVRVAVDRADRTYRGGEEMKVTVHSATDGYLYLFYLDAQKKPWVLFPNHVQTDNKVAAGKPVTVPAPDARFRLRVGPPFGSELLKAVVALKPLTIEGLEVPRLAQKEATEVNLGQLRALSAAIKANPSDMAEHEVEITTVAPGAAPAAPKERRVGLYVGIGKYKSPGTSPLPVCPTDVRTAAAEMKARCGVEAATILVDEQATLANVEKTFRQELVAKSKPGDTVILFWSGHGGIFPNLDAKKMEHFLVTHDTAHVDLPDKPTEADIRRAWEKIRGTSLTSDTLQRWVEDLDGRRVIIVADACFASGLHDRGKSIAAPGLPDDLRNEPFLADLMRRAKGLHQKDLALLAGCKADQTSKIRREGDLSVLTYYLLEQLRAGNGPLTLKQAFDGLKPPLTAYVARAFPTDDQTPILIDDLTPPFYLRAGR